MKKAFIILLGVVISLSFFSCNDTSYAKELEIEKELISNYIKRNNIKVISSALPSNEAWPENNFYKTSDNIYINITKAGIGSDSIENGNKAILRFKSYTLNENPDSLLNWTTVHFPSPPSFTYYNPALASFSYYTLSACEAWYWAIYYMKRAGAEAKIIVPSKKGFSKSTTNTFWGIFDDESTTTPRLYILQLKFEK